jgi:CRP-like cAMP-binding protein
MGAFLFKAAFVWLTNAMFNLLPFLDLDGYFLLVDYLEMPALRANALTFVREGLLPKLRAGLRLTREEVILTAYGVGYGLLVILIPLFILEVRDLRYASSLGDLWDSPEPHGRLLAVASALMLLGPAVASLLGRFTRTLLALSQFIGRWWSLHVRGDVPREHIEPLADLPFLRDVPRTELRTIAHHLDEQNVEAGEWIVRQGEVGDRFYIVAEGAVRVVRLSANGEAQTLATLGPGDYFGEAALVANVPRTATVIAETPGRLLTLDAGHFRRWMTLRSDVERMVQRSVAEREILARLPLFGGIGTAELDRLAAKMLVTRYSPEDRIVEQGTVGNRFYVLTDGRVEVLYDDGQQETRVAELGVGDFFGEMALLHQVPRTATVRALSPVETYTLTTEDFGSLLDHLSLADEVRRTASSRADRLSRLARA